jgi:hypothetical protein
VGSYASGALGSERPAARHHTHTHARTHTHTVTWSHTHTHIHTRRHGHTDTHTHTCTHTQAHTHTRARAPMVMALTSLCGHSAAGGATVARPVRAARRRALAQAVSTQITLCEYSECRVLQCCAQRDLVQGSAPGFRRAVSRRAAASAPSLQHHSLVATASVAYCNCAASAARRPR